jgi:hypothetical protein
MNTQELTVKAKANATAPREVAGEARVTAKEERAYREGQRALLGTIARLHLTLVPPDPELGLDVWIAAPMELHTMIEDPSKPECIGVLDGHYDVALAGYGATAEEAVAMAAEKALTASPRS